MTILALARFGIPVSTTHAITGAIGIPIVQATSFVVKPGRRGALPPVRGAGGPRGARRRPGQALG